MPCSDISDRLSILLDPEDHLLDYQLKKRTCGAPVGNESLLLEWVHGQSVESLLATPYQNFVEDKEFDGTAEFLAWKHYRLLLNGLAAYTGEIEPNDQMSCTVVATDWSAHGAEIVIDIQSSLDADNVTPCGTSCGNCKGNCGAKAKRR